MTGPAAVQGLSPDTPVEEAAAKLLHARFADLRKHEIHAVTRLDPNAVHDLRVSCRRLRAAIKVFGAKPLKKLDPLVEHLQDALGEVRDVQLQLRWLEKHGGVLPAREKALSEKEAALRSALAIWSLRSAPRVLRALPQVRKDGKLSGKRMRKRLRRRIADVSHALEEARSLRPASAHALRIAAKKLRYEAELLREAFDVDGLIEDLSALQDAFGDLHDADARVQVTRRNRKLSGVAQRERQKSGRTAAAVLRKWQRGRVAFEARKRI
ncbi:MAG: CHAD domain-containing protein [Myxococcales bacterium]